MIRLSNIFEVAELCLKNIPLQVIVAGMSSWQHRAIFYCLSVPGGYMSSEVTEWRKKD